MYVLKNTSNSALVAKELFPVVMEVFFILFGNGEDP